MSRKALRLAGAFLKRRPVWCSWQLTRRCASYCMFCEHRLEGADEEIDLAGCARVAEALADGGALVVSLTGGEPFLRADLPEIVRIVAARHYPLLTTHGWLVTREKARAVWAAGLEGATVRLHHAHPDRHDEAAGLPRAHARALEAVAAFAAERPRGT
ncbi:MAG TPA: radical SAM protein, partial [Vicinamibacteria bacterium]|nr:radical SAM protein [Vicinamibacteria bacterium]